MNKRNRARQPAGIEYVGEEGQTHPCQDAIVRFLQSGDRITNARILTCNKAHSFLLTIDEYQMVAVKSGFSSGYGGTGPTGFSYVLELLNASGTDIEEIEVSTELHERLDASALTVLDLESLEKARCVRPRRWHQYIDDVHQFWRQEGTLWKEFPTIMPFAIIDPRIIDLALGFFTAQNDRLLTGYRRLEDLVRRRCNLSEHGSKLFSQAFMGEDSILTWPVVMAAEQIGRAQLFVGAYSAFRNPRAHREIKEDAESQLAEFLLLNHLFRLEREAAPRPKAAPAAANNQKTRKDKR